MARKGSPQAGLSIEQGMEACQVIGNITSWMGHVTSVKVKAISLGEADEMVQRYEETGERESEKGKARTLSEALCSTIGAEHNPLNLCQTIRAVSYLLSSES